MIKKRLFALSMAASMMLPTIGSIPVLAENTSPDTTISTDTTTPADQNLLKTADDFKSLEAKTYVLDADVTLTDTVSINAEVTINLNGHTITSSARDVFDIAASGKLNIQNDGETEAKIISTTSEDKGSIVWMSGAGAALTIDPEAKISLELNATPATGFYGVGISQYAEEAQVTLKNIAITSWTGIYVNGSMPEDKAPTVTLDNVSIQTTNGSGIYQAGPSNITVTNCNISSPDAVGAEVRAGKLEVKNSVIEGGSKATTVEANGNGSTTAGVGIAIAQHTTNLNIDVTIENSKVSGYTALAITNPQNNTDPIMKNSSIKVTGSVLQGDEQGFDVAYEPTEYTEFKFDSTTFQNDEKPTWVKIDSDGSLKEEDESTLEAIPYTITKPTVTELEKTPSTTLGLKDSDIDLSGSEGTLTTAQQNAVKTTLQQQVTKEAENKVLPLYGATEKSSLAYTYTVVEVAPEFETLGSDAYNFKAKVTAKLSGESIVRLMVPLKQSLPTASEEETEEMVALDVYNETGPTVNPYPMDVKLSDITKDGKTLDGDKIKLFILQTNGPLKDNYSDCVNTDKIDEGFNGLEIKDTYVVERINVPIEITADGEVSVPEYKAPTSSTGGGGGNKKPSKPAEEPMTPVVGTPTSMYRLYNRLTGEHLYTIDKNERDNLLTSDTWKDEGEGWIAPSVSDYPVYRLLNPNNGDHHYTTDKNEFDTLPSYGWIAEGVAFFSADKDNPENVLLHRLYNPNAEGAGSHHYTADTNERDALVAQGWKYEGLAWAGLPANK